MIRPRTPTATNWVARWATTCRKRLRGGGAVAYPGPAAATWGGGGVADPGGGSAAEAVATCSGFVGCAAEGCSAVGWGAEGSAAEGCAAVGCPAAGSAA